MSSERKYKGSTLLDSSVGKKRKQCEKIQL